MQQAYVGGDVTVRPHRWVLLTAAPAFEDYTLKDPTGASSSRSRTRSRPKRAPGVGVDPAYLHTTASAAFDWRPAADYARRGGLYRIARHHYADRDGTYSFDRLEAEVVQHIPILRENWVISMRGRLETTLDDDDQVPYFLLPSLGSGSTLRGYSSWRFRDRHAMLLSGEWRWIPNRMAIDMAFFYDTGMVAPRLDAIALGSFVSDFGVGVRFHAPARDAAAHRARERVRGHAARVRRERGVLIMTDINTTRCADSDCAVCWPPRRVLLAGAERALLRRRSADTGARDAGRLEGERVGDRSRSSIWRPISSAVPAIRRPTCARATSTRSTKCRTRAGSPTASWRSR